MTRTIRIALATFVFGFLAEAAAEIYEFASYGISRTGWIGFYYVGLVTTGLGFYLMYVGRREWTELHRQSVKRGHRLLRVSIAMFLGAFAAIGVLGTWEGRSSISAGPMSLIAWVVGGLVALALGNFFLSLVTLVYRLVSALGRLLAWAAFAWSLGVAVLTGIDVGGEFPSLLREFFTRPWGLIVSFAPLAFVLAPLFVTYLAFAVVYTEALLRLRRASRPRASAAPEPGDVPGEGAAPAPSSELTSGSDA
jgi:hypothetical protein